MSEERMNPDAAETQTPSIGESEGLPPIPGLKAGVPRVVPGSDNHWLTRPSTVRRLWWIFGIILALTVVAQFFIPIKGKFRLESTFGFAAWYGFFACVAMVLVAKVLGWWLKRPEDYYAEDDPALASKERDDA
jgi:hypothetical protein